MTFKMPEPAGYWILEDGRRQPVADAPGFGELLRAKVIYGWKWEPFQRQPESPREGK